MHNLEVQDSPGLTKGREKNTQQVNQPMAGYGVPPAHTGRPVQSTGQVRRRGQVKRSRWMSPDENEAILDERRRHTTNHKLQMPRLRERRPRK